MKAFIKEWGGFSLFIATILLSRIFIWSPVTVEGHSMDPTLTDKEKLIMVKTTKLDRFDIVVASEKDGLTGSEKLIVKRIIGMPGDTIRYENDTLYVNDQKTDEPYLADYIKQFKKDKLQKTYSYDLYFQDLAARAEYFTTDITKNASFSITVPEGEYFLMGDDRLVSQDSRAVGTFTKDQIEGEIVFRFWPFKRIGGL